MFVCTMVKVSSTYLFLQLAYCSNSSAPRLYGLPKIDKDNGTVRPIVSFVNAPSYQLLGFLARIIDRLGEKTDKTVKNSGEFVQRIRGKNQRWWDNGIIRCGFPFHQHPSRSHGEHHTRPVEAFKRLENGSSKQQTNSHYCSWKPCVNLVVRVAGSGS